ncbi:hypothetical protein AALO_G00196280 [Alosa alosa]|uniref:Uncharacterized protein n=1 Tax=Alosa alosa TaxID=278164 RepID=A0AAV6G6J9_9TELE|nr:hypothetical protein AALO_G00196280 [Alosa alosa]
MAKKEMSCFRRESNGTGGGSAPKPISSDAAMVADIIGRDSPTVMGIAGGQESGVIMESEPDKETRGERDVPVVLHEVIPVPAQAQKRRRAEK